MAKAHIVLPDGTKVDIDGSVDEVSALLERLSKRSDRAEAARPRVRESKAKVARQRAKTSDRKVQRKGPIALITELADENFFKAKRTISEVKGKLEEAGHIYPIVQLSTPLLRLTRKRILRRIKEKDGWVYVS